ncbi:MAG: rRNA (cytidine1402-2-O)-methyltransferase [Eubacteriales bacterium]|nr:rRNA (cytidine1402-2-O)-methyltransferase [Eubacteriales bacterium]
MSGVLYVCATPIGNLEDITLRVLRILREVDLIAAEDTRHTRKLLHHYDIHRPLTSYHEHNRRQKGEQLLRELMTGKKIALVTDAGTPAISDPGWDLVQMAIAAGIQVVPLPGPSALVTALVVSGLPTERFVFEGFLPREGKERRQRLQALAEEERTIVLYEAPHRLRRTVADLLTVLGEARPVALARELTKIHEEVWRGTLVELQARLEQEEVRGEIVLVVGGRTKEEAAANKGEITEEEIAARVREMMAAGKDKKEAMKTVALGLNISKKEVYRALLAVDKKEGS